jgi:hypothetical protein
MAALLVPSESEYISHTSLGFDEESIEKLKFNFSHDFTRFVLLLRKFVLVRNFKENVDNFGIHLSENDIHYIESALFLPFTQNGSPAVLMLCQKHPAENINSVVQQLYSMLVS